MTQTPIFSEPPSIERMECMEIFGGNQETSKRLELPGLDVWLISQPFRKADRGGDVHYVSSCASGRISRILLADISGHGEEVADMGTRLRDLMRANINVIRQTKFIQQMNEQFASVSQSERFATAVVFSYFSPTRTLELSNAGHPQPLFFDQSIGKWSLIQQREQAVVRADDTPLGVVDDADYSEVRLKVNVGDMLLSYSDALIEAEVGEAGPLGSEGLLEIAQSLPSNDPESFLRGMFDELLKYRPDSLSQDDVTVILTRVTQPFYSFKNNLLAPFRLLGKVNDKSEIV